MPTTVHYLNYDQVVEGKDAYRLENELDKERVIGRTEHYNVYFICGHEVWGSFGKSPNDLAWRLTRKWHGWVPWAEGD